MVMRFFLVFVVSLMLVISVAAQHISTYASYDELAPILHQQDDTVRVINFWATWCKPCVAEMPYFEMLRAKYADQPVQIILVSLDFPHQIDSKLIPFVQSKSIQSKVVALTDTKVNKWINQVHPDWTGAIPATVIYRKDKKHFKEGEYPNVQALEADLLSILNP